MRRFLQKLTGNDGLAAVAVTLFVLLALAIWMPIGRDIVPPKIDAGRAVVVKPKATVSAEVDPKTDPMPATETPPDDPPALRFDEVRRELDGTTVVAARAAPGSEVIVIVNGTEIARGVADTKGAVAALAQLPDFDVAQVLELRQITQVGDEVQSEETVILTPRKADLVIAAQQTVNAIKVPVIGDSAASGVETAQAGEPPLSPQRAISKQAMLSPGPAQTAALISSREGVSVLNAPSPEVIDNLALDTISYSDVGDVQLAGRAQEQARNVRVYLDNRAIVTLVVDASGHWRGDLPDVDEGVYTLRVDEMDGQGVVTSRVETPFKRESPATLAAVTSGDGGPITAITVQKGATLWAIARERYGDGLLYVRVFEANSDAIRDPDLIYPGQVFDLPE